MYMYNDKDVILNADNDVTADNIEADKDATSTNYGSIQTNDISVNVVEESPATADSFATVPNIDVGDVSDAVSVQSASYDTEQSGNDELCLLQAQVFLEDAAMYRSVDHKVDRDSLKVYRLYHSRPFYLLRCFVIMLLHMLAFIEWPSSMSWTSDIRRRGDRMILPCGVTEGIELACLCFLLGDVCLKYRIYGSQYLRINRWLGVEILILGISLIDWAVSICIGCTEVIRVRRMLRPIFIIQSSSLMKKILNSLRKTMSQILGVLLLMALHLYIFTLCGMLFFHKPQGESPSTPAPPANSTSTTTPATNSENSGEGKYFQTLTDSFISMLVLLTTANNPDVTMGAYRENRLFALFFIIFLIIGLYCFMNMLTAIIYNQFRGYFLNSMQSSLMRRRLGQRAAFEALKRKSMSLTPSMREGIINDECVSEKVSVRDLKVAIYGSNICSEMKVILIDTIARGFIQDQMLSWNNFISVLCMMEMDKSTKEKPRIRWFQRYAALLRLQKVICHKYFSYFGNIMAASNVILISFELATEYDKSLSYSTSGLKIINFMFILYYIIEQALIFVCLGWRRYKYSWANLYDGTIVLILLISEVITIGLNGFPMSSESEEPQDLTRWNVVRAINILIMLRVLRVIWHIKAMAIVAHTLLDLVKNLQSFGGILIVIYYFFAMLGMELFQNKITFSTNSTSERSQSCGTYEQLEYWANNFDDFAATIVVLWDVMVVNNWYVFLNAYATYTSKWAYLYFIVWWLTSVILILNLFTALILENFIMKWDRFYAPRTAPGRGRADSYSINMNTLTVHDIFRPNLKEPSEEEILENLSKLKFFHEFHCLPT